MKKIEAIVRPEKLDDIKDALLKAGVGGLTISQVFGAGRQKGHKEFYRGSEVEINLLQKIKIEVVCSNDAVERIVSTIVGCSRTGEIGDGKIFVSDVSDVIRIRTGESGDDAV